VGIDIFFKDESLRDCRYAFCAEHRKTPVEVVYNDREKDVPYWQFRRIHRTDYRHEDIALPPEQPLFAYEYMMRKIGEEQPQDLPEEMADGLKTLIIQQNTRPVLEKDFIRWVEKQEFDKLVQWCVNQPDENRRWVENAWYGHLDWNQQRDHCRRCPVAPLDEDSCSLRFSNYPSMDYFKAGMIYLIAYAQMSKGKKLEQDPFSFPYLDRKKKQTPRDKLAELWAYCAGAEPNKTPEESFNKVFEVLNASIKPSKQGKKALETTGHKILTAYVPIVDEFLAKCVYRDEPYTEAEAEKLVPILETIDELGEYAKHDAKRREAVFAVEAFQVRLRQLVKALKMAKKFNIEFGMSY